MEHCHVNALHKLKTVNNEAWVGEFSKHQKVLICQIMWLMILYKHYNLGES